MERQKLRSEIDKQYKWDLSKIYPTEEKWNKDFEKLSVEMEQIKNYTNFNIFPPYNL